MKKGLLYANDSLTPLQRFNQNEEDMKYNFEKVSYALTDLKNLMCTTDAYIEKFLPFRINKELGNYLQFVLDET